MNWKRGKWGAVIGAGGGILSFGLSEDMWLLVVTGLAIFVSGFLKLRAFDRA
ncbi:hypothetical protein [Deinococcus ficus]|uniref:hypothetical protein n=1 Tax=Deinococcus ficus TaxID=317577 RepID=UPI0012DC8C73|nr:hypothetical protein [Deinococcus ficus]